LFRPERSEVDTLRQPRAPDGYICNAASRHVFVDRPRVGLGAVLEVILPRKMRTCVDLALRVQATLSLLFAERRERHDSNRDQTSSRDDAVLTGSEQANRARTRDRPDFCRVNAIAQRLVTASLQCHALSSLVAPGGTTASPGRCASRITRG